MMNLFQYTNNNKRYYTLDYFYKQKFHSKVFKVSLNAGFTCPNIDGTVGTGGCIYCSNLGSGDFAGSEKEDLLQQFEKIKTMMEKNGQRENTLDIFKLIPIHMPHFLF